MAARIKDKQQTLLEDMAARKAARNLSLSALAQPVSEYQKRIESKG